MPLHTPPPDSTEQLIRTAVHYWNVIYRVIPIVIVGSCIALVLNISKIAHKSTAGKILLEVVSVVSMGGASALVAYLGLPLFVQTPSPEIEILIGAIAGGLGQRIFDIYARRIFGVSYEKEPNYTRNSWEGEDKTDEYRD